MAETNLQSCAPTSGKCYKQQMFVNGNLFSPACLSDGISYLSHKQIAISQMFIQSSPPPPPPYRRLQQLLYPRCLYSRRPPPPHTADFNNCYIPDVYTVAPPPPPHTADFNNCYIPDVNVITNTPQLLMESLSRSRAIILRLISSLAKLSIRTT